VEEVGRRHRPTFHHRRRALASSAPEQNESSSRPVEPKIWTIVQIFGSRLFCMALVA
jgi:hypothetical protein